MSPGPRHGVVVDFDATEGLGRVRGDDGTELPFHCVAIADGSRSVPVGAEVTFTVGAGLPGRWEARQLAQLAEPPSPSAAPPSPSAGAEAPSEAALARPDTAT